MQQYEEIQSYVSFVFSGNESLYSNCLFKDGQSGVFRGHVLQIKSIDNYVDLLF